TAPPEENGTRGQLNLPPRHGSPVWLPATTCCPSSVLRPPWTGPTGATSHQMAEPRYPLGEGGGTLVSLSNGFWPQRVGFSRRAPNTDAGRDELPSHRHARARGPADPRVRR